MVVNIGASEPVWRQSYILAEDFVREESKRRRFNPKEIFSESGFKPSHLKDIKAFKADNPDALVEITANFIDYVEGKGPVRHKNASRIVARLIDMENEKDGFHTVSKLQVPLKFLSFAGPNLVIPAAETPGAANDEPGYLTIDPKQPFAFRELHVGKALAKV